MEQPGSSLIGREGVLARRVEIIVIIYLPKLIFLMPCLRFHDEVRKYSTVKFVDGGCLACLLVSHEFGPQAYCKVDAPAKMSRAKIMNERPSSPHNTTINT